VTSGDEGTVVKIGPLIKRAATFGEMHQLRLRCWRLLWLEKWSAMFLLSERIGPSQKPRMGLQDTWGGPTCGRFRGQRIEVVNPAAHVVSQHANSPRSRRPADVSTALLLMCQTDDTRDRPASLSGHITALEPPWRIELQTYALRVRRSAD
jgi:hypothetical protein